LLHEGLEPLIGGWELEVVDAVQAEPGFDRANILFHLGNLCIIDTAYDGRRDERREDAQNDHDHHDLDEREAAAAVDWVRRRSPNASHSLPHFASLQCRPGTGNARIITNGFEPMSERVDTRWMSRCSPWLLGLFATPAILLALGGEPWRALFEYRDEALQTSEYWRFLTGHFVHGNVHHLLLNLLGVLLMAVLFPTHFTPRQWVSVALGGIMAIDLGLWWRHPEISWYFGLSGVLHGVLGAGIFGWWRDEPWVLALTVTAIAVIKVALEQLVFTPGVAADIPVVIDAHLYGLLGGGAVGALICYGQRRARNKKP
jgi:rhomboid family GlyGly-CTERM serine protease